MNGLSGTIAGHSSSDTFLNDPGIVTVVCQDTSSGSTNMVLYYSDGTQSAPKSVTGHYSYISSPGTAGKYIERIENTGNDDVNYSTTLSPLTT